METFTNLPTILLVEDTDDDAFFFVRTLKKAGLHCECNRVTNGIAAKAYLLSNVGKPHIVFLDLRMPEMDGFEVLEWLRDQTFKSDLTVIVLSGSDSPSDVALGTTSGRLHHQTRELFSKLWAPGSLNTTVGVLFNKVIVRWPSCFGVCLPSR